MTFDDHISTFKYAFPKTIPILAGFAFLGMYYGIYMNSLGFEPIYAISMSLFIFAGSMEFVAGSLLLRPLRTFECISFNTDDKRPSSVLRNCHAR